MHVRACSWSLLLAGASLALSSCATLLHSNHQSVRIFSTPSEAKVVVDGRFHLTTAGTVNLSRYEDHTAVIEKEGYEPVTITIERRMSKWVFANLVCLMFIFQCIQKDRENGGFWTFDDDIDVTLTKRAEVPPAQPHTP
jgi:hypothetical protein